MLPEELEARLVAAEEATTAELRSLLASLGVENPEDYRVCVDRAPLSFMRGDRDR